VTWPLDVYEMQHVTDEIKEGRLADYAKIARTYDRTKLSAGALTELAHLLAESGDLKEALQVGRAFIQRFGDGSPDLAPKMRRSMAAWALHCRLSSVDHAGYASGREARHPSHAHSPARD
jgi:hypothetical protein